MINLLTQQKPKKNWFIINSTYYQTKTNYLFMAVINHY